MIVIRAILSAVIYLLYWAVFWFAKLSGVAKWRGLQYRATVPLASWTYRNLYGGTPEAYRRY